MKSCKITAIAIVCALAVATAGAEGERKPRTTFSAVGEVTLPDELDEIRDNLKLHELNAIKLGVMFPGAKVYSNARAQAMRDAIRVIELVHMERAASAPVTSTPAVKRVDMGRAVAGLAGGVGVSEVNAAPGGGSNRPQVSRQLAPDAPPGTRDTYTYQVEDSSGGRIDRNNGWRWLAWLRRVARR